MTAEKLKALRKKLGLTQTDMAEKLGIGIRQYQFVEAGTSNLSKASIKLLEMLDEERQPL
jgi:transcriptional regulator with XRE-family HTH domain